MARKTSCRRTVPVFCSLMLVAIATLVHAQVPADYDYSRIEWKDIADGLQFAGIQVDFRGRPAGTVAVLRVDPEKSRIRVFHSFEPGGTVPLTIDEWQKTTSALAVINGGQYMAEPYMMPCAPVLCDGRQKGPRSNNMVRGMLVAEPRDPRLPKADLLDFAFDRFDLRSTSYTQGIQHWPILLDRTGAIRVKPSPSRANRTVVAKDSEGRILFLNTQNAHFTLYAFAVFLKAGNGKPDKGLRVRTAMNLDGGHEANMLIRTPNFSYENFGESAAQDGANKSIFDIKVPLPGVIGVFPRKPVPRTTR